ncbi:MAG: hypothetical protein NC416_18875 [Eubacterium sp.]|nr:hypothetical protein [Eubacterium sp.]
MGVSLIASALAQDKIKALQKKTGKPFNECSSALHLADGDINRALKIMRKYPDHEKRLR